MIIVNSEERNYYLAFSTFEEGIGPVRFKLLLDHFKSAKNAWEAKQTDLITAGIPQTIVQKFLDFRSKFDLELYLKELAKKEISFLTIQDNNYPYLLKQISDPPFVLYIRGSLAGPVNQQSLDNFWLSDNKLAIVGTRIPTSYGREITEILTSDLVVSGLTIVSGMARGIDTVAHRTAIKNGGQTIAVLGCGVDLIYPPENKELYYQIANGNGCIISEMPLGRWANKGTFPARNRIISGLSRGVLMTEGASDSGALITCSYAGEQGRDVFAVPGPVTSSLSAGTLSLLKKGAKLVTNASDVLEELGLEQKYNRYNDYNNYKNYKDASEEENQILELLKTENLTVDDIIRKSGFPASICSSLLSLMEIKGYIKNLGNLTYGLKS